MLRLFVFVLAQVYLELIFGLAAAGVFFDCRIALWHKITSLFDLKRLVTRVAEKLSPILFTSKAC